MVKLLDCDGCNYAIMSFQKSLWPCVLGMMPHDH